MQQIILFLSLIACAPAGAASYGSGKPIVPEMPSLYYKDELDCEDPQSIRDFKDQINKLGFHRTRTQGRKVQEAWSGCLCGMDADEAGTNPKMPPIEPRVPGYIELDLNDHPGSEGRMRKWYMLYLGVTAKEASHLIDCGTYGVVWPPKATKPLPGSAPLTGTAPITGHSSAHLNAADDNTRNQGQPEDAAADEGPAEEGKSGGGSGGGGGSGDVAAQAMNAMAEQMQKATAGAAKQATPGQTPAGLGDLQNNPQIQAIMRQMDKAMASGNQAQIQALAAQLEKAMGKSSSGGQQQNQLQYMQQEYDKALGKTKKR